ncbi:DUF543-domain-containing protein [Terfezia boudieri ATCC MYA-4762]|uniref:MICOS complex subunit MIC10 n=1 Tax=Terfezia boudieri ATCC MYA-4762 TaxID=1051890 RepID=A0A3N4LRE5_9PEZI|nr:DUF543-domain-containing protein [Terfezia boudieri ATCC MYA-4762]
MSSGPKTPATAVARTAPPPSEALLSEKWDRCLSNLLIKSTLGAGFGIVFSVLIFRRRAWPAWVGLGFGAGRGYAECDADFKGGSRSFGTVGERIVRG